jgi:hypothetical protein
MAEIQSARVRLIEILLHVPPRIDDDRRVCALVADQIRGMSQATKIELLEDHRSLLTVFSTGAATRLPHSVHDPS